MPAMPARAEVAEILSRHGRTGRPLGDADFVAHLEAGAESASSARKTWGETAWGQENMSVASPEFAQNSPEFVMSPEFGASDSGARRQNGLSYRA